MGIFLMLGTITVIIVSLYKPETESAAFNYHTYNNIQGEEPSRSNGHNIHGSSALNTNNEDNDIHRNYNMRTSTLNKNGHNNIPENYDYTNNYIPTEKARNNTRKNYILVTYFFNNHTNSTSNNSRNNYTPGAYTTNSNGGIYTPREPVNDDNSNNILGDPSSFYKCTDYFTLREHYLGEIWYNNTKCEQYVCKLGEQNIPYTQTNRCGVFVEQPNCEVRQNYGRIYPSCCPVLYCNGRYEGPVVNDVLHYQNY